MARKLHLDVADRLAVGADGRSRSFPILRLVIVLARKSLWRGTRGAKRRALFSMRFLFCREPRT